MPGNRVTQPVKGQRGEQGFSIKSASLVGDNLVLESTSGSTYDVGNVKGATGPAGSSGSDISNPEPLIISENFVSQMQNFSSISGSIQLYSFNGYGEFVSPRIFQPLGSSGGFSGNNMYIVAAQSETDHFGVIEIVVEEDVIGILSLSNASNNTICIPSDINKMVVIIKTPTSFPTLSLFKIGFSSELGGFPDGIYFDFDPGASTITPTISDGSNTSIGSTTALTTNTWYTLEITKVSATSFDFTINGTTTNINTNVPSFPLNCGFWIDNSNGPSPSQVKIKLDFFSLKLRNVAPVLPTGTTVVGTANEVEVTGPVSNIITIGLPDSILVPTINTSQLNFNTSPATPTNTIGGLYWDTSYKTLSLGLSTNTQLKIGESLYKYVRNTSGSLISKGKVVYVNGHFSNTQITIGLANANSEATSADVIGVTAEDIADGTSGFVQTFGYLTGIATNTAEIPVGQEGKALYLSGVTAGNMRIGLPTQPLHGVRVGFLLQRAGSGTGSIFVNVQNYQELEELSDVLVTNIANNDILQWDNIDGRWENRSLSTAGISATGHTHSGSDITSGTVGFTYLPTGTGSTQVAIGNHNHNGTYALVSHTHTMADITDLREQKIFVECECNAAGEFSTISSNSGTNSFTGTGIDTTGGHYGVLTSATSTTNNAVAGIGSADTTTATVFGTFKIETTAVIMFPQLSTSGERFFIESGWTDNRTGTPTDGVLIQYCDNVNSGKFVGLAYNNNTLTQVDLGITATANTWYKLNTVVNTNGSVDFYIDGVLKGQLGSGSAPTGSTRATSLSHTIRKSVGTTSRGLYIDYINYIVWCSR